MPKGDGTGPQGQGPMTGRRMGRCESKGEAPLNQPTGRNQPGNNGLISTLQNFFRNMGNGGGRGKQQGGRGRNRR